MKWEKAPEEHKTFLEKAMAGINCEKRLMFGYPAFFINKNMFSGLFQRSIFLRLAPGQIPSLKKKHPSLSALEPMAGRPMKDYFVVPEALYKDEKAFKKISEDAAEYALTLPPKKKTISSKDKRPS
jgi:TfoX/Sxy family transcriptional regulator of competence genes